MISICRMWVALKKSDKHENTSNNCTNTAFVVT